MKSVRCFPLGVVAAVALGLLALKGLAQNPAPSKPLRVYVSASQSWSAGGWSPWWGLAGGAGGGARPQTVEITKSFAKNCPAAVPTLDRSQADFVLIVEHEGGKSVFRKDTKYALYDAAGDHLASGSARMVGTAARKACEAIAKAAKPSAQTDTTVSSRNE